MVKDYGKICASSASGKIFYGKNNTILWKDAEMRKPKPQPIVPVGMPCQIVISWSDPTGDLDIVGFWTRSKPGNEYNDNSHNYPPLTTYSSVGWGWSNGIYPWPSDDTPPEDWPNPESNINGYKDWWSGDNTKGGPEELRIDCDDKENVNDTYEVHCNWYSGHGTATLTITDNEGNVLKKTIHPSEDRQNSKAFTTDHGFIMHFSKEGVLTQLETV